MPAGTCVHASHFLTTTQKHNPLRQIRNAVASAVGVVDGVQEVRERLRARAGVGGACGSSAGLSSAVVEFVAGGVPAGGGCLAGPVQSVPLDALLTRREDAGVRTPRFVEALERDKRGENERPTTGGSQNDRVSSRRGTSAFTPPERRHGKKRRKNTLVWGLARTTQPAMPKVTASINRHHVDVAGMAC